MKSQSGCRGRPQDRNELRILALKQEISEELPRQTQDLAARIMAVQRFSEKMALRESIENEAAVFNGLLRECSAFSPQSA
jgi:hypothetical protein